MAHEGDGTVEAWGPQARPERGCPHRPASRSPELALATDGSGCIRDLSPSLARLLGPTRRGPVGTSFLQLVHRHDVRKAAALLRAAVERSGASASAELRIRSGGGSWHALEWVARAEPGLDEAPVVVLTAREVPAHMAARAPEPLRARQLEELGAAPPRAIHTSPFDPTGTPAVPAAQGETVLVVLDERALSVQMVSILEDLGYTVLEASSPADAEGFARIHRGEIHLVIADLATPRVRGCEFLRLLHSIRPELRSIYLSSQRHGSLAEHRVCGSGARLLRAPFTAEELAHAVRRALDDSQRLPRLAAHR